MNNHLILRRAAAHGQDIVKLLSDAPDTPLAIIIPNYISKTHANHLYNQFRNHPRRDSYAHEMYLGDNSTKPVLKKYGVDKVGFAYNSTYGKKYGSIEVKKYYEGIRDHIIDMARRCVPYSNPIHRFIKEMNSGKNKYPFGMQIAAFDGHPMYAGIVRIMEPKMEGGDELSEKPHVDELPLAKFKLTRQLTCNIYFKVPAQPDKAGGDLELWDMRKFSVELNSDILDRDDLRHFLMLNGAKPIMITPQLGDLIIFDSRKPHSVKNLLQDVRMTLQTFIGYQGPGKPLLCWN